jgi:hypothetical protein
MMNLTDVLSVWLAVFVTLMVLSFLYKENPFFRLAEYVFIGLSSGYGFAASLRLFINQALDPIFVSGSLEFIVPVILGALFYTQFTKKYSLLYRVPLSLAIGYGLGITIWSVMQAYFIKQVVATMIPLYTGDLLTTIQNLVLITGTILSLSYFILFREQTGPWGVVTRIGKYFILITLGAVFGSTVLGRMQIIIQRIQFLVGDPAFPWLALRMGTAEAGSYAPYAIVAFLLVFGFYIYRERGKKTNTKSTPSRVKA